MKEFIVNEYITLKLEGKKTNIYVNGELFRQCRFLLINIPIEEISTFDDIESIDDAAERSRRNFEQRENQQEINIPPETEFWGHCSNLQVWAENNYNTRLLTRNLAFPLLKKLSSLDPKANQIFKEEIARRFNSGNRNVIRFLIKAKYIDYLKTQEEREAVFYNNSEKTKELVDDFLQRRTESDFFERRFLGTLIYLGDTTIKEEIARLFNSGNKDVTEFLLKAKYLYCLEAKEMREAVFYNNSEKTRELVDDFLQRITELKSFEQIFLEILIQFGDTTIKEKMAELLHIALTPRDLDSFNLHYAVSFIRYFLLNEENREKFFYKNNPEIRAIIDEALETKEYALTIGLEFLLTLYRFRDPEAIYKYKDAVLSIFFSKDPATLGIIISKHLFRFRGYKNYEDNLVQQLNFFSYGELKALAEDPGCPEQFLSHWNDYKEKLDTVIHFYEESFVSREELLKGTDFLSKLKIPNSEFFLEVKEKNGRGSESSPIPIYNKQVKKIIINSTESPIKPIIEKIDFLKSKLEFIHEEYFCTRFSRIGIKNVYELYFLYSNSITNREIDDMFTSISQDIRIEIKDLN